MEIFTYFVLLGSSSVSKVTWFANSFLCPVSELSPSRVLWEWELSPLDCGGGLEVCGVMVCFLGRVERSLGKSDKNQRHLCLWDSSFDPRGRRHCSPLWPYTTVLFCGTQRLTTFSQAHLDPACVESQPASLQRTGELESFLPPPFLLFLFRVNSSCRSNIDKYSRECFSGRRMLLKHFLTIFGKNWSFCVFQTARKRGEAIAVSWSDIICIAPIDPLLVSSQDKRKWHREEACFV